MAAAPSSPLQLPDDVSSDFARAMLPLSEPHDEASEVAQPPRVTAADAAAAAAGATASSSSCGTATPPATATARIPLAASTREAAGSNRSPRRRARRRSRSHDSWTELDSSSSEPRYTDIDTSSGDSETEIETRELVHYARYFRERNPADRVDCYGIELTPPQAQQLAARKRPPPQTPPPLHRAVATATASEADASAASAMKKPPRPPHAASDASATTNVLAPLRSSLPAEEVHVTDMRPLLPGGGRDWRFLPEICEGLRGWARDFLALGYPQLRQPLPPLRSADAAVKHVTNLVTEFGGTFSWLYVGLTSEPENRWRMPGRDGRAHCDHHLRMLVAVQGHGRAMRELEREVIAYYSQRTPWQLRNTGPGGEGISDCNPAVALYVCIGTRNGLPKQHRRTSAE